LARITPPGSPSPESLSSSSDDDDNKRKAYHDSNVPSIPSGEYDSSERPTKLMRKMESTPTTETR
jgi:hypothetical protein